MYTPGADRKPLDPYVPARQSGRWRQHGLFAMLAGLVALGGGTAPALMLVGLYVAVAGTRAVVAPRREGIARFLAGTPRQTDARPDGFLVETAVERSRGIADAMRAFGGLEIRIIGNTGKIAVASDFERTSDTLAVMEAVASIPGVLRVTPLFRSEAEAGRLRFAAREEQLRRDRQ